MRVRLLVALCLVGGPAFAVGRPELEVYFQTPLPASFRPQSVEAHFHVSVVP